MLKVFSPDACCCCPLLGAAHLVVNEQCCLAVMQLDHPRPDLLMQQQ
jgi:hypothetical protein